MSDLVALPDFDALPCTPDGSLDGCAWKLFDKNGQADQLGTLNLLTQERVLDAARREILCGQTVTLNWGLEYPQYSGFKRSTLQHRIIDLSPSRIYANDDEVSFCPQHGSHWDTPLHFAHQKYALIIFQRHGGLLTDVSEARHTTMASAIRNSTRRTDFTKVQDCGMIEAVFAGGAFCWTGHLGL